MECPFPLIVPASSLFRSKLLSAFFAPVPPRSPEQDKQAFCLSRSPLRRSGGVFAQVPARPVSPSVSGRRDTRNYHENARQGRPHRRPSGPGFHSLSRPFL